MASKSVNDLQATIEEQNKKINKYEAKLRDIVSAYKSLQKEKVALEEIVKNITSEDTNSTNAFESGNLEINAEFVDPLNAIANAQANEIVINQWKDKVAVMTKALSTITEEKSRMEINFQADKKKINQEKDELNARIVELERKNKENEKRFHEEIDKYKNRLRSQQKEHEKEQHNLQLMLRELQNLVSSERSQYGQLETQLEEAQVALALKESQPDKSKEYNKEIAILLDELKSTKLKLKEIEAKAAKPSPMEVKLKNKIEKIEAMHRTSIIQEQERSKETEDRLNHVIKVAEDRVAGLEGRIAELSEIIGNYERQRQQDYTTIQRLKERNCQLDIENTALAKVASCVVEKETDDSNLDLQSLKTKINKLKGLMKLRENQSDGQFDSNTLADTVDHTQCQLEIQQIKDEFENYKIRMQSILKNKHDNETLKEAESLRIQVKELKEKLNISNSDMEDAERQHRIAISTLHAALDEMRFSQKQQLAAINSKWQNEITALEQQLERQRERSFALLEEREKEIEVYKLQLGTEHRVSRRKNSRDSDLLETRTRSDVDTNLLDVAVELSKLTTTDKKESQFLHYAQEMARKDVEISNLRRAKFQLETTLREQELATSAKEEKYTNQIESLNNQILRLERNTSREGANLEYLKNVVLSYMLSSSSGNRQHMLNAISTVLKFSAKELESVKLYNSTWWWNQS